MSCSDIDILCSGGMLFGPCFRSLSILKFGISTSGEIFSELAAMVSEATNIAANACHLSMCSSRLILRCLVPLWQNWAVRYLSDNGFFFCPFFFFFCSSVSWLKRPKISIVNCMLYGNYSRNHTPARVNCMEWACTPHAHWRDGSDITRKILGLYRK